MIGLVNSLVVRTAVAGGAVSVSREPHFKTLPGRYIAAEPPRNPLELSGAWTQAVSAPGRVT